MAVYKPDDPNAVRRWILLAEARLDEAGLYDAITKPLQDIDAWGLTVYGARGITRAARGGAVDTDQAEAYEAYRVDHVSKCRSGFNMMLGWPGVLNDHRILEALEDGGFKEQRKGDVLFAMLRKPAEFRTPRAQAHIENQLGRMHAYIHAPDRATPPWNDGGTAPAYAEFKELVLAWHGLWRVAASNAGVPPATFYRLVLMLGKTMPLMRTWSETQLINFEKHASQLASQQFLELVFDEAHGVLGSADTLIPATLTPVGDAGELHAARGDRPPRPPPPGSRPSSGPPGTRPRPSPGFPPTPCRFCPAAGCTNTASGGADKCTSINPKGAPPKPGTSKGKLRILDALR